MIPARLQVLDRHNLALIYDFDLSVHNIVEPIHVLPLNDIYLITDCNSHIIVGINTDNEYIWNYGTHGNPGRRYNELCVPLMTDYHGGNILISEQRSNRVIAIDFYTKDIVKVWGIPTMLVVLTIIFGLHKQ